MPESGYWSEDSKTVMYRKKRDDSALYDLYQVDVSGTLTRKVGDADLGNAPAPGGDWNRDHSQHVFVRDENGFVRSVLTGHLRQLTRDNVHRTRRPSCPTATTCSGTRQRRLRLRPG